MDNILFDINDSNNIKKYENDNLYDKINKEICNMIILICKMVYTIFVEILIIIKSNQFVKI